MYILPFVALILIVGFIFFITKPKKKKKANKGVISLRTVIVGDSIYYYDRWWTVMSVRGDADEPTKGIVSGKDKDGNISSNISFSDITDHRTQK